MSSPQPVESIETDQPVKQEEADAGSDHDGPAEGEDTNADNNDDKVSNDLYKAFKAITESLLNFKIKLKSNEEHFPSGLFKRLPNKRLLPEYYDVIKEPSAISTLRGKIQRKSYTGVPEFIRDFALIVHNAQIFNRPNSQPVRDVLKLDEIFKDELKKLVDEGLVAEEDTKFPDLGEIPYATPEPDPVSEDEAEEDGDEDDDEEEADDSDEDRRRKRGRRGTKTGASAKKTEDEEEDDKVADAEQKRRGRPPKVATPMEHRIDRILKSMKKTRAKDGAPMIIPFERLPDKAEHPDYYQVIQEPIAYDTLRKKAKRKKYNSIEQFMKDVELMFTNAMTFNEDGSDIYNFAQELLAEAKRVEAEERARPDSDFIQAADGRIPLPFITYKNEIWKVGDWIHLQNPNDVTKPIIAQIYRTWKTNEGEEWINACWYYRPEQTVHQYEKHFFPNEVVKTGQYRDHRIEEVVDKCFVMFYTRFNRGRPRGLKEGSEVYVCEARYNEDKAKFNKIKTWASCLPDEVRDKDYEMDMFDAPRKIKKVPSPLKHLLKDDMKETDDLPQPRWGHSNAPPLVGGIHKHPRDENQSPPPEPTPPPPPAPPASRPSVISMSSTGHQQQHSSMERQASSNLGSQSQMTRPTQSLTPQPNSHSASNANATYNRPTTYTNQQQPYTPHAPAPQTPYQSNTLSYASQQQAHQPALTAAHPGNYTNMTPVQNYGRPSISQPIQNASYGGYGNQSGNVHRAPEAYVLSDAANESIPKEIRDQFPQDDNGRVLFFTQPPIDTSHIVTGSMQHEKDKPLKHTDRYKDALSLRKRKHEEQDEKVDDQDNKIQRSNGVRHVFTSIEPSSQQNEEKQPDVALSTITKDLKDDIETWMSNSTLNQAKAVYGKDWRESLLADLKRAEDRLAKEQDKDRLQAEQRKAFNSAHLTMKNGSDKYAVNSQGYIKNWQKDFFTGVYLDDHNPRLPF